MQTIALGATSSPAPTFRHSYRAPWGKLLCTTSVLVTLLCLGVAAYQFSRIGEGARPWATWSAVGLVVALLASVFFTVKGYALEGSALVIERLLWTTRIPLAGLLSATHERRAMRGSLRTCGNGGAFSFTGWYWSSRLGHYRAFVTDFRNTVILRFPERTVVVSPERPQEFAREILAQARR